jgi:hypothetical protein
MEIMDRPKTQTQSDGPMFSSHITQKSFSVPSPRSSELAEQEQEWRTLVIPLTQLLDNLSNAGAGRRHGVRP